MKKLLNLSLVYAILGMCGGVFYREFTKLNNFTGTTALGKVHTHFLMLGMFVFLIAALFARNMELERAKTFKPFIAVYNIGLALTGIMMTVRGILDVKVDAPSKGLDASISGMAGIGHILTGAGLVLLIVTLKKCASMTKSAS